MAASPHRPPAARRWRFHVVAALVLSYNAVAWSDALLDFSTWSSHDKEYHTTWQLNWLMLSLAGSGFLFSLDLTWAAPLLLAIYCTYLAATISLYALWWNDSEQGGWTWEVARTAMQDPGEAVVQQAPPPPRPLPAPSPPPPRPPLARSRRRRRPSPASPPPHASFP